MCIVGDTGEGLTRCRITDSCMHASRSFSAALPRVPVSRVMRVSWSFHIHACKIPLALGPVTTLGAQPGRRSRVLIRTWNSDTCSEHGVACRRGKWYTRWNSCPGRGRTRLSTVHGRTFGPSVTYACGGKFGNGKKTLARRGEELVLYFLCSSNDVRIQSKQ
jgi:hypothetical protein